jgi:hypothetical protein
VLTLSSTNLLTSTLSTLSATNLLTNLLTSTRL